MHAELVLRILPRHESVCRRLDGLQHKRITWENVHMQPWEIAVRPIRHSHKKTGSSETPSKKHPVHHHASTPCPRRKPCFLTCCSMAAHAAPNADCIVPLSGGTYVAGVMPARSDGSLSDADRSIT